MSIRNGLLGLAGLLAAAGAADAKPPDLPLGPPVQWREPDPVAREFHEPAGGTNDRGTLGSRSTEASLARAGSAIAGAGTTRLPVTLGAVQVGK